MNSSVTQLKGVGEKVADKLSTLNIHTVQDLLFHLPHRYEDRTTITPIRSARFGDTVLIEGVMSPGRMQYGKRRSYVCHVEDETGIIQCRFFYFSAAQIKYLTQPNKRIRCFGAVRRSGASYEIVHPECNLVDAYAPLEDSLRPVYPTTDGVSQNLLNKLIDQCLQQINVQVLELLPSELLDKIGLPPIAQSLSIVHKPKKDIDIIPYLQRLAFEELLAHHLSVKLNRTHFQEHRCHTIPNSQKYAKQLLAQLPFTLTQAQQTVLKEISHDLDSNKPMLRLLQGDVGSGKTIVALLSALSVVEAGKQVALMAPTEILVEQHYLNFKHWCDQLEIGVVWLTGSVKGKQRLETLSHIATGRAQIVIGTHALFQQDVVYNELALIVIDEQHRFGVDQRLSFYEKGKVDDLVPHQLVMTATPIPRSLAMTAYADLDCSIIDELPPGRRPVATIAIDNSRRDEVIERIRQSRKNKQQVYWVCTLIEESESLQCKAAELAHQELKTVLPEFTIALVHGRMKAQEKEAVMAAFKRGDYDVLVATTVIEVGVDIPSATLMIIENPERLGLSQLHQLRGRVGRGALQSYCVLMYQHPLTAQAKQRLAIMRETNDGFEIANKDLIMRGPGELLGTRQTGDMAFKIADLLRDQDLLPRVHQAANYIQQHHPESIDSIIIRWQLKQEQYAQV